MLSLFIPHEFCVQPPGYRWPEMVCCVLSKLAEKAYTFNKISVLTISMCQFQYIYRLKCVFLALCLMIFSCSAWALHGYALWGDLKYSPGFAHFDYVNPDAPKGGELVLVSNLRVSNFDKYNPFSLKGTAPAYLSTLVFESLLTTSLDEASSAYGLLADDVEVAPDHSWVRFHINPLARFSNGEPVLAQDVVHSYNMLVSDEADPGYRMLLTGVFGARVGEDALTVYFDISEFNRELPLLVGSIPIFSHQWGDGKPFGDIRLDEPIASGPYVIGPVVYGRDITYVRNPAYWGAHLNVMQGQYNFDRITVRIYVDDTAKLEGFKAGEFDFLQEFSAGNWARQYRGKRFDSGDIVKGEFEHALPYGFQGYILNTRRPHYADVRVRRALNLAYDFEWMNRTLFYGSYNRINSYFGGSDYQATGMPSKAELALLQELQSEFGLESVPDEVLYEPAPVQPITDPPYSLRDNLLQARALLEQAGWTYRDGALRNEQGEPFVIEYMDSRESGHHVHAAWSRALERLGIRFSVRTADFSLYRDLLDNYDFDMTTLAMRGSAVPGNELYYLYSSRAAQEKNNGNYWGIQNPAIDALINCFINAQDKESAVAAGRALDRMLLHGAYSVLQFYSSSYRVAYDASKLAVPEVVPSYYEVERWVMGTWWSKAAQQAQTPSQMHGVQSR